MSLTLSQMASRVLRNIQVPEDSSQPGSVQALVDAKQYLNERARDVWKRRHWREYVILGTYSVPASTNVVALGSITVQSGFSASGGMGASFYEIVAVRNGSQPLLPEDMGAINAVKPDQWAQTTDPIKFINRGRSGIFLLGQFSEATTLSFFGKAAFADLADGETWVMDNENCLIAGATADMLRDNDRDDPRAMARYQEYEAEIAKMIDASEVQGANLKRIIPLSPFTDIRNDDNIDTTATGSGSGDYIY